MNNILIISRDDLRDVLNEIVDDILPKKKEPLEIYPEYLSRSQLCEILNVTLATVDNWHRQGRLKKHRIGGITRFKKSEILDNLGDLKKYQR